MCQKMKLKYKNFATCLKNEKFIKYLIICLFIGFIVDLLAKYVIHNLIYTYLSCVANFLDNTIFSANMSALTSAFMTIGSLTFSIFSLARTSIVNNQKNLLIDNNILKIIGIKTVYNPYVFIAIGIQFFSLLLGWGTLLYLMAIYQIYSFVICLKNYLKIIDSDKLNELVETKISKLNDDNPQILEIIRYKLSIQYNNNFFEYDYNSEIFIKFDKYLYNEFFKSKSKINEDIEKYCFKSNEVINSLSKYTNNYIEQSKIIYMMLVLFSPSNIKRIDNSSKLNFFNVSSDNPQYLVFYYSLLFNILKYNPEKIKENHFRKIVLENAEICYAIILFIESKHACQKVLTDIDKELYKYINSILTEYNPVVNYVEIEKYENGITYSYNVSDEILCSYWIQWYKSFKKSPNIYNLGEQIKLVKSTLRNLKFANKNGIIFLMDIQ